MKTFILQHIGAIILLAILATVLCAWLVKFNPLTRTQRQREFRKVRSRIGAVLMRIQEALYLPRRLWKRLVERESNLVCFANVGEGTHEDGLLTKKADAALTTRFLLVKFGSSDDHVAVNGATDMPLGIATDEADAAEDLVAVQLLGSTGGTVKMVASEAITAGELVYTAASGKVQDEPTGATVFKVGRALTDAAQDQVVIVEPCLPLSVTFA